MDKASQAQLELIAALGVFEGKDLSKEDASKLINEAQAQGVKPDWGIKEAEFLKIAQIMKSRLTASLSALKSAKAEGAKPAVIRSLQNDLDAWVKEIEDYKKNLTWDDDDDYARVDDFHVGIEHYKGYGKLSRKPTREEIKLTVEELDRNKPDWEQEKEAEQLLLDTLTENFKRLRANDSRPSKKKKRVSRRHLLLIAALLIVLAIFAIYRRQNDNPKVPEKKTTQVLRPSSIKLTDLLWLNADENDNMRIRFELTNSNPYPVSGISVVFKLYDVTGVELESNKTKKFPGVIKAGERKLYDDITLGDFHQDTTKVTGAVVTVSKVNSEK